MAEAEPGPSGDPLKDLKAANPDIDPAVLERAVANIIDKGVHVLEVPALGEKVPPDSRKRGADVMTHATPNPWRALAPEEASTSSAMVVTTPTKPTKVPHHTYVPHQTSPAKGSTEELAFINDKKKD